MTFFSPLAGESQSEGELVERDLNDIHICYCRAYMVVVIYGVISNTGESANVRPRKGHIVVTYKLINSRD